MDKIRELLARFGMTPPRSSAGGLGGQKSDDSQRGQLQRGRL
jgi:hypothetical protein